jgi:dTDP-4-dehydrorhamnose reductase
LIREFDYCINCIGIIKPFCKDEDPDGVENAIVINSLFPHKLGKLGLSSQTAIIQIATDCVFSGNIGNYHEDHPSDALDAYGKSKKLGEVINGSTLNIRCSIVGPEKSGFMSLLEWFLRNPKGSNLLGFNHHLWNGVTTLQFAKLMEIIIMKNLFEELLKISEVLHFTPNETVTKYELLNIFNEVFAKDFTIAKVEEEGRGVDRTLTSKYSALKEIFPPYPMKEAIMELHHFMEEGWP